MPFSLGSKVSLKSAAARPASEATLYGFTNNEDHEDLSNPNIPLTYVSPVDSGGIFTIKLVSINKTDIVDLYFIGQGDTGACWSDFQECNELCLEQGPGCFCSSCSKFLCPGNCFCNTDCYCLGNGTYATGGYGRPWYVRLDFSTISETDWSSKQTGYILIDQFTQSANVQVPRNMIVEIGGSGTPLVTVEYTESNTTQGGAIITGQECNEGSCTTCNNCDGGGPPYYGAGIHSQITLTNNFNATITTQVYGNPGSDGTIENIFYSDFGWSGMTGVTWENYGTGGSGCFVSQTSQFCSAGFRCTGGGLSGGYLRPGRILGVAINPSFEP